MSNISYRVKNDTNNVRTSDYKEAQRVAKRLCKESGSAIIEKINDKLQMVIDEEYVEYR